MFHNTEKTEACHGNASQVCSSPEPQRRSSW